MRILKKLLWMLLVFLVAAILAVTVSTITEHDGGESIISFLNLRVTITGIGAGFAFLTMLLFSVLKLVDFRKRNDTVSGWGERLNAIGFGLLPGVAVWKVFEQATLLAYGTEVPDPLPQLTVVTSAGCFAPSRIELICSVLYFAAILLWLILRKNDLPGDGDLLFTVLCVWMLFRALTESFRGVPLLCSGNVNLLQILFLVVADICLIIWTVRQRRTQKSTAFAVLEWFAVLCSEAVIVMNTSGILTAGSGIGDMAVCTGCTALCIILMLLAGKDSRN